MKLLVPAILLLMLISVQVYSESADLILIEKSKRRLTLYSGEKAIGSYPISLGFEPEGAKLCEGDGKTPEGLYRISVKNPMSSYHLSLGISYPNKDDRRASMAAGCPPGGDIMIHGLPPKYSWARRLHLLIDWTAGCIAVTNRDIEEIWELTPVNTKVRIEP
ncbi:L,D-transpeptidase family protein [Limisalsivibrio acetivorans]|uniref:L,D-transpeptidase family protein n=1 Tax=Limisalsivibrio acetivorans TaxID=1304888 RepID=UPI0003B45160|nr:L,D-transpeptidase family protein [Limisalsivibrio acetivorans]